MIIHFKKTELPFIHPFTISKGTKTHQPSLIVSLQHFGKTGYGEAPAINYYNITVEKMLQDLTMRKQMAEKFAFTEPERYWHYLHHLFPANPFLVSALDMAAWDMTGKIRNLPLYKIWGLEFKNIPLTDYTIGIDSVDKMVQKMNEKPWPIYKIKVGVEGDIEMVEALRKNSDAKFRVDANAGWTLEQALEKIPILKDLGVELVEQPLAKDNWEGMKKLYEVSSLPIFADESCVFESDVEKCQGYFHGINIKLTKCSGITPALRMIKKAKELELKTMIGCMNESTLGSAAIAQLSPMVDLIDMDGPLLLSDDLATGITYDYGHFKISDAPGLGVSILPGVF